MNKGRRNEIAQLKKKKRLRVYISTLDIVEVEGKKIHNPKLTDVKDWKYGHVFKTTGKPCSCEMCSPYKYNRKTKHKNRE